MVLNGIKIPRIRCDQGELSPQTTYLMSGLCLPWGFQLDSAMCPRGTPRARRFGAIRYLGLIQSTDVLRGIGTSQQIDIGFTWL